MPGFQQVRVEFSAFQNLDEIIWEIELSTYVDKRNGWTQRLHFEGRGDVPGQLLGEAQTAFEVYATAIAKSFGVQLELPFE